jgi:hypothetical protein
MLGSDILVPDERSAGASCGPVEPTFQTHPWISALDHCQRRDQALVIRSSWTRPPKRRSRSSGVSQGLGARRGNYLRASRRLDPSRTSRRLRAFGQLLEPALGPRWPSEVPRVSGAISPEIQSIVASTPGNVPAGQLALWAARAISRQYFYENNWDQPRRHESRGCRPGQLPWRTGTLVGGRIVNDRRGACCPWRPGLVRPSRAAVVLPPNVDDTVRR